MKINSDFLNKRQQDADLLRIIDRDYKMVVLPNEIRVFSVANDDSMILKFPSLDALIRELITNVAI